MGYYTTACRNHPINRESCIKRKIYAFDKGPSEKIGNASSEAFPITGERAVI